MTRRDLLSGASRKALLVNENGYRIGEAHQWAKLTDAQVEAMRVDYEENGLGYRRLAVKYDTPKRTVRDIVHYRKRNHYPHVEAAPPSRRVDK